MARGGARPGAGRKKGISKIKPKRTLDRKTAMRALEGMSPLDYMLGVLQDAVEYDPIKMDAAKYAAPYVHPKLAAVAHQHNREADVFQIITNVERVEEKISEKLNEGKTLELTAETVKDGDSYH